MGKRVLITGCSTGIGRALAAELTGRGYEVIATARNLDDLEGLSVAEKLCLDVTSDVSTAAAVAKAGRVDILVNNAGIGLWGPAELVPLEVAKRLFEVNVFGPMRMHALVLPQMRERGEGMIVQVSSLAGRTAGPLVGHYAATKHALEAMSCALRVELAAFGIKVAIVELGAVESDFGRNRATVAGRGYERVLQHFTSKLNGSRAAAVSSADTARAIADVIAAGAPHLIEVPDPTARAMIDARLSMTPEALCAQLLDGLAPEPVSAGA